LTLVFGLTLCLAQVGGAVPMGTAFTFQGRLLDEGRPADGLYDFEFKLFDADEGGNQKGNTVDFNDLDVIDGHFVVELDFGSSVFNGSAVWLETTVMHADGSDPCTLRPRQEITAVPYALQTRGIFVDDAGKVGIGTTVPGSRLSNSSVLVSDGNESTSVYGMNWRLYDQLGYAIGIENTASGGNGLLIEAGNNSGYGAIIANFVSYDSSKMIIRENGRVGIGITDPIYNLDVAGDIRATGAIHGMVDNADKLDGLDSSEFAATGHLHDERYYTETELQTGGSANVHWNNLTSVPAGFADGIDNIGAADTDWIISGSDMYSGVLGKVGIGVETPATKLHVYGNLCSDQQGDYDNYVEMGNSPVSGYGYGMIIRRFWPAIPPENPRSGSADICYDGESLKLLTADGPPGDQTNGITITNAGDVGIGTTAPGGKLSIAGPEDTDLIAFEVSAANRFSIGVHSSGPDYLSIKSKFEDPNLDIMAFRGNGYVGVGITEPEGYLHVDDDDATNPAIYVEGGDASEGDIAWKEGEILHVGQWDPDADSYTNHMRILDDGTVEVEVLTITGAGGSDLAEPFAVSDSEKISAGALVVIDEENPGQLKLSAGPYDKRIAGVVSGAGGLKPGVTLSGERIGQKTVDVALTGRVYVMADCSNGPITPGDMLTTSGTPGHAMKATDQSRSYGAIAGKAMSSLKEGRGLVLMLVNLQ